MGLSRNGRKLALEVVGCASLFVLGAVTLVYRKDVTAFAVKMSGLSTGSKSTNTDDNSSIARADSSTIASSGSSLRRRVELSAGSRGHFFTAAEFNGRSVDVMVDTGASMVALTADDARRAGISPRDSDFTGRANTANGIARFAPVVIDRISIGGLEVRNVSAAVMEDGKMDKTLLGMSFLSKLSVSMKSGHLVLEE